MQIHTLDTGFFKLDGGAMFGVVPKSLWQKQVPADERNLCTWAMRCLLVEEGNRLLLVDTGMGHKQEAKFTRHYEPHGEATLLSSIQKAGYAPTDITDVFLTHLHFDHVGGAVSCDPSRTRFFPTFPNATYWTAEAHWQWALHPNPREKASFLGENLLPLQEAGQLRFLGTDWPFEQISYEVVHGHTEAMTLPLVRFGEQRILFAADLIPSSAHIPLAWVMGYDVRPLVSMQEKADILQRAATENWLLVFEHDATFEAARVLQTERGMQIAERASLKELL